MKHIVLRISLKVLQGDEVIYRHPIIFLDPTTWKNQNREVSIPLPAINENSTRTCRVITGTLGTKSGKYRGTLKTSIIDIQAMEAKTNELEALLEEYGAQLNGNKHKYDAHLLSISADKFTTTTIQEVELAMDVRQISITQ